MKYYIIAGEASGDLHGSNLVREIARIDEGAEVRAWGDFPFEEDDTSHYAIAEGFTTREVLRSLADRSPRLRRRGSWPAGVRARASRPVKLLDRGARTAGTVIRKASRARTFAVGRAHLHR